MGFTTRLSQSGLSPLAKTLTPYEAQIPRKEDTMKFLHTMIRVNNLDESIKFYCDVLGMKLLRKSEYPSGKFTLALSVTATKAITRSWN